MDEICHLRKLHKKKTTNNVDHAQIPSALSRLFEIQIPKVKTSKLKMPVSDDRVHLFLLNPASLNFPRVTTSSFSTFMGHSPALLLSPSATSCDLFIHLPLLNTSPPTVLLPLSSPLQEHLLLTNLRIRPPHVFVFTIFRIESTML
jgi:hypothetical protein